MIQLDTHVVVWLYAGELARFPPKVRKRLESDELRISPVVLLELQYLHELGRVTVPALTILQELQRAVGLELSEFPFDKVVLEALLQSWTRDPFDRMIAAQSLVEGARLITKDEALLKNVKLATWAA